MKEYTFRVFLKNEEVASISFDAKSEEDAWIMIKHTYPPIKGFTYKLEND